MNIITLQIVLLGFAIFMVYSLFLHWKKKDISNLLFSVWVSVWVIFVFFTFFPKILEPLIKELFIVRVMDLGMICAFMILTYLTVENNIKIKKLDKDIEVLVRKVSIKKFKIKK